MDTTLRPAPAWPAVFREQLRTVRLATRRETIGFVCFLAALAAIAILIVLEEPGGNVDFLPQAALPVVALGLVAPMIVWKGEEPSRRSYFWAMPVDRARHTLARALAGWVWLMGLVALSLLWALLLALVTGGEIGVEGMRVLVRELPAGAQPTAADMHVFWWSIPAWQWLAPFTGATITYLLGSILALSAEHPWRWFVGLLFGAFLLVTLAAESGPSSWLYQALSGLMNGYLGIEPALAGTLGQADALTAPSGRTVQVYRSLPAFGAWAVAMPLWMLMAGAGVWMAARRHQEH